MFNIAVTTILTVWKHKRLGDAGTSLHAHRAKKLRNKRDVLSQLSDDNVLHKKFAELYKVMETIKLRKLNNFETKEEMKLEGGTL